MLSQRCLVVVGTRKTNGMSPCRTPRFHGCWIFILVLLHLKNQLRRNNGREEYTFLKTGLCVVDMIAIYLKDIVLL